MFDYRCYHYSYPDIAVHPRVFGEDGYIWVGDDKVKVKLFSDADVLDDLGVNSMAILDPSQVGAMIDSLTQPFIWITADLTINIAMCSIILATTLWWNSYCNLLLW